ncbi:malonyl-CoA-acyl carrier protein transacylase, mitochondrial-like [Gigantopelta aegis]|uniref:malonyl-CoA-acyl carrier protein transacylase, mitochondrial-like n=1 Tax=Gigantopelta aegis TaxID=1735272 RepID=UPI001B88D018|nr:malonyl-CoA-acyl carrier protein transacylase, mitochondrial-like [Gigantopelta aegis]
MFLRVLPGEFCRNICTSNFNGCVKTVLESVTRKKYQCSLNKSFSSSPCLLNQNDESANTDIDKTERKTRIPRRILKRVSKLGLSEKHVECYNKHNKLPEQTEDHNEFLHSSKNIEHLVTSLKSEPDTQARIPEFPSDVIKDQNWFRNQGRKAMRPKVDPKKTSVILFQGQGSQFVGMGEKLLAYDGVERLYAVASDILGYDLLQLCIKGPKNVLDKTIHCQPAVMVTSIAAIEKLKEDYPEAVDNCVGTAGFSVGEYAALVFAGSLTFEDAVRVVKVRAEAMQTASEAEPSGMMSVFIGHDTKLNFALLAAREFCQRKLGLSGAVCCVANYLYADCKVIAGHDEALNFLENNYKDFGIRRLKRLPVSGAFHTDLMRPARGPLVRTLREIQLEKPLVPVHCNVNGNRYRDVKSMINLLGQQIYKPVKWEQTMHILYSRDKGENFPFTYELGPGKQLGTLMKLVNAKAYELCKNIDV